MATMYAHSVCAHIRILIEVAFDLFRTSDRMLNVGCSGIGFGCQFVMEELLLLTG